MKGASLLETLVTIAIIAILTLMGVNTINNFRHSATLDNTANELLSYLRTARNKSVSGELLAGEDNDLFEDNGLPEYGITLLADGYRLIRRCQKSDATNCSTEPAIDSVSLPETYSLSPEGSIFFERITGTSQNTSFTLTGRGGSVNFEINDNGAILIKN
jgi:Tfp pilus assembly protein FimT